MASDKCLYCGHQYNHAQGCPVGRFLGQTDDEEPEEITYQTCAACKGNCGGCMVCWDKGVVPHDCGDALSP